jgi:transposase-like protein
MLGDPKCPRCKSNSAAEESRYRDEGTHFCTHCNDWFGRKQKPKDEQKREAAA